MTLIRDVPVLLADTGPFCRLAEAGEDHLEVAAEYLRANVLATRRRLRPGHEDEDRGEVATALTARALDQPALMDDGFGKRLAAQRGVQVVTTQDLAVELAAARRLSLIRAYGIYRIVYKGSSRREFEARVVDLRRTREV